MDMQKPKRWHGPAPIRHKMKTSGKMTAGIPDAGANFIHKRI
jgi:hypothetical protein